MRREHGVCKKSGRPRRRVWAARFLAGAVSLLVVSGFARAQGASGFHFGIAGSAEVPVQNQSDVFTTGWNGTAILAINFRDSPFGIRVDGAYGEINTKSDLQAFVGTGTTRLITGTADLVIGARHGPLQPYLIGGVGAYDLRFQGQQVDTGNVFSDSTTRFGWNAGLGIAFPVGSAMAIFVEARYTSVSTDGNRFSDSVHTGGSRFTYVPVNVGFIF
jgi:opacity protein-like surface antigen